MDEFVSVDFSKLPYGPVEKETRQIARELLDGLADMLGSPIVRTMVLPKVKWTEREIRDALEYLRGLVAG